MTELKDSFDTVAEDYNRYRTGYDPKVVAEILAISEIGEDSAVCEIGAGTGQASEQFAPHVSRLICVEPGEHLASLLSERLRPFAHASVINACFEDAQFENESFELVIAAQSFHWVDPLVRYKKSHDVLKRGGYLAAFWKYSIPSSDQADSAETKLLRRYIPNYELEAQQGVEERLASDLNELAQSRLFDRCQLRRYPAPEPSEKPTPRERAASLRSTSMIASLPRSDQDALIEEMVSIYEKGDCLKVSKETVLLIGRKRG